MCYNKEVSFVLALFGILCAAKEFKKGVNGENGQNISELMKGAFIFCLALMQLNEFFLHYFNNPKTM